MEIKSGVRRAYNSEHRSLKQHFPFRLSAKFTPLLKDLSGLKERLNISESDYVSIGRETENRREYSKLESKLALKEKMKVVNRNFNKTYYTKLSKKIIQKPESFYKFGLRQDERASCKEVLTQLFKISKQNLNGTISVNDLWDKKMMMRYLKQNEAYINKQMLIKQFESYDREQKRKKKQRQIQRQRDFVRKYREWADQNKRLNLQNSNYQKMKQMNVNEACNFIRQEIQRLNSVQKSYRKRSKAIMDELQNKYDSFDQIASKFKDKMMLML